jgi:hypothetical protein
LYPKYPYRGTFTPQNLLFDANLQEFAQKISYISSLEVGGKLTPQESYQQVKTLWKQLKASAKELGISGSQSVD